MSVARVVALLGALSLAPITAGVAKADAEGKPVVAIVAVDYTSSVLPVTAADRHQLTNPLAKGLASAGWQVIGFEETSRVLATKDRAGLAKCQADMCMLDLSKATGAPFLVWAKAVEARGSLSLEVKLIDAADASHPLGREYLECGTSMNKRCGMLRAMMADMARALGRKTVKKASELTSQMESVTPRSSADPISPPQPNALDMTTPSPEAARTTPPHATRHLDRPIERPDLARQPQEPTTQPGFRHWAIVGWSAIAAAVPLGIEAYFLWKWDGEATDSQQTLAGERYFSARHTKLPAVAFTALSAVAAGTGIYLVKLGSRDSSASLALTPTGIVLGGRY